MIACATTCRLCTNSLFKSSFAISLFDNFLRLRQNCWGNTRVQRTLEKYCNGVLLYKTELFFGFCLLLEICWGNLDVTWSLTSSCFFTICDSALQLWHRYPYRGWYTNEIRPPSLDLKNVLLSWLSAFLKLSLKRKSIDQCLFCIYTVFNSTGKPVKKGSLV